MGIESSVAARQYFPHINLLRAFAALSVLVYHVIEHYSWHDFPIDNGLIWFRIGWMSVDLFFVISGFVIGWSLISMHNRQTDMRLLSKEFLWRRMGRIVPLYLITLFSYAAIVEPDLFSISSWRDWLTHLTFTYPAIIKYFGSINGVNWSVGIEVHFYLAALITSPWWIKKKPLTLFVMGCMFAWVMRYGVAFSADYFNAEGWKLFPRSVQMPMMLDEFAAGIALALFIKECPPEKWCGSLLQQGLGLIFSISIVGVIAFYIYWNNAQYWDNPLMITFWRSIISIFFMLIIALFIWLPAFKKPPLIYKGLYYLGDISYGIYLWHIIVIMALEPYLIGNKGSYLIVITPIVIVLASLSWHWLEKPMINWSKNKSLKYK